MGTRSHLHKSLSHASSHQRRRVLNEASLASLSATLLSLQPDICADDAKQDDRAADCKVVCAPSPGVLVR